MQDFRARGIKHAGAAYAQLRHQGGVCHPPRYRSRGGNDLNKPGLRHRVVPAMPIPASSPGIRYLKRINIAAFAG